MCKDTCLVADLFDRFQMDQDERERVSDLTYLYPDLIVKGYHHFFYGTAGSGKTTILMHLSIAMCRQQEDIVIYYFYLDGTQNMASNISLYIEELGLNNRIKILTTGSAFEYTQIMNKMLETNISLNNIVFIYDTFKVLTSDINVKNANKEAMHFIKKITNKGATFISLGHSNKDGAKQSGTAEIEQDSDALIRIDGIKEKNGSQISTIEQAGRCRMDIKAMSFSFQPGMISSVKRLDEVVKVGAILISESQEKSQLHIINAIIELLTIQPLKQKEIIEQSKSHPILSEGVKTTV